MSIQSDMIKVQIHVAEAKLNALETFTAGGYEREAGQLTTRKMLIRMLQAELAGLEELLT